MSRLHESQEERKIRKLRKQQQRQQRLDQILQQQAQQAPKKAVGVPRRAKSQHHVKWSDNKKGSDLVIETRLMDDSSIPRQLHGFNLRNIDAITQRLGPGATPTEKAALLEQAQIHYDKFRKNAEDTILDDPEGLGNPEEINAVRLQFTKDCHGYLNGQIDAHIRELEESGHAVNFHQVEAIGEEITTDTLAGYHKDAQNRERAHGMHAVPPEVKAIRANLATGKSTLWNTRASMVAAQRGAELSGQHAPTHAHHTCLSTRG
jgi:hypothetical protein